jgi:hypothetical protein
MRSVDVRLPQFTENSGNLILPHSGEGTDMPEGASLKEDGSEDKGCQWR